jgi:hypothetical protein
MYTCKGREDQVGLKLKGTRQLQAYADDVNLSFIHSFIYLHVKNPLHVPRTGYRQLSSTKHEHIKYNAC